MQREHASSDQTMDPETLPEKEHHPFLRVVTEYKGRVEEDQQTAHADKRHNAEVD